MAPARKARNPNVLNPVKVVLDLAFHPATVSTCDSLRSLYVKRFIVYKAVDVIINVLFTVGIAPDTAALSHALFKSLLGAQTLVLTSSVKVSRIFRNYNF
jgi:hypothetical protein